MKHFRLILDFYLKNIVSSIFLFVVFTVSLYFASTALGQYRYITYTKDLFMQSNLQNLVLQFYLYIGR